MKTAFAKQQVRAWESVGSVQTGLCRESREDLRFPKFWVSHISTTIQHQHLFLILEQDQTGGPSSEFKVELSSQYEGTPQKQDHAASVVALPFRRQY